MRRVVAWALAAGLLAGAAETADLKSTANELVKKSADAVVTVQLVVKTRVVFQGQEGAAQESKLEINGTVVSPSGLTVVSDFSSNPAGFMANEGDGPKFETETTDVRILLRDERELPARFVLRDQDLDLAFVMPDEKDLRLSHVPLDPGPVPDLLDDLLFLSHLGRPLNRETSVSVGRVRGVTRKPRTFVISDLLSSFVSLGCPVFDGGGRLVGLVVMRRAPQAAVGSGSFRDLLDVFNPVILTAQDVQQVAAQVLKPAASPPAR